ncbi:hypothetical protein NQ317_017926 [Molorchus minor]|uniref:Uncharacterized protein n=1 Tax=Molorchus minor TaxID=1323400 RepID=A0ABQ9J597_9CUCU|nr:hypothetical protein NQ317_017926 [Molorchus minor]
MRLNKAEILIIIIYTLIQASEEPHSACARKEWLLLLFNMAPWKQLRFILITHLLYTPEKTRRKTRNITNSSAGEFTLVTNCTSPSLREINGEKKKEAETTEKEKIVFFEQLEKYLHSNLTQELEAALKALSFPGTRSPLVQKCGEALEELAKVHGMDLNPFGYYKEAGHVALNEWAESTLMEHWRLSRGCRQAREFVTIGHELLGYWDMAGIH